MAQLNEVDLPPNLSCLKVRSYIQLYLTLALLKPSLSATKVLFAAHMCNVNVIR